MGPCAGGAVYSPAITDFTVMVEGTSYMFVTGPERREDRDARGVDRERLGGAHVHNETSGVAHLAAPDEAAGARADARRILGYLPQNNLERPPRVATGGSDRPAAIRRSTSLIPDEPTQPYDMHDVIDRHRR